MHFAVKTANHRHSSKQRQHSGKHGILRFSAFHIKKPFTHCKLIANMKKNNVLHAFQGHNTRKCENNVFEADFALFQILCKTCMLCTIIVNSAKIVFLRPFFELSQMPAKLLFHALYAFCSKTCKSSVLFETTKNSGKQGILRFSVLHFQNHTYIAK